MGTDNIYGSYVHGIFDAAGISDAILQAVCSRKGIDFSELGNFQTETYKEKQYDLLADTVRVHLDMEKVYRIIKKEV